MSGRPRYPQTHPAMAVARNIVSQVLEEAGVDVATCQRINDDCDQFVAHMVEGYAPIKMSSEQWMDCLAHAWDMGHMSLCRRHGVMPFEACRNPYRVERKSDGE